MGILKDYLTFSKRERTGSIVLIGLIVVIFLLPEFYPEPKRYTDPATIEAFSKQAAELKKIFPDSASGVMHKDSNVDHGGSKKDYNHEITLFNFDPNTVSDAGWSKLGVSDRTTRTIRNYLSKGGSFRNADDLGKIYGIQKSLYEMLRPFVVIKKTGSDKLHKPEFAKRSDQPNAYHRKPEIIDINASDTSMWIALPGIGSKLASRIIGFRDKLGGFYSVEQIKEVYGLPDSTFQRIRPYVYENVSKIRQININTVDAAALKNHPYMKWNIANAIVNYRLQHGNYDSLESLLQIDIITPELLSKLSPYLSVK